MFFDTVHQALITHTGMNSSVDPPETDILYFPVYTYTITNWGNTAELDKLVWLVANHLTMIPNFLTQAVTSLLRSMLVSHCQKYACYISMSESVP